MAFTTVNGTNFLLYIDGTAVAGAQTVDLEFNMETRDDSTKDGGGYEQKSEGMRSWGASGDGLVTLKDSPYSVSDLFQLYLNRSKVQVQVSTETSGEKFYQGYGFLNSLSISTGTEESVSMSFSFEGDGAPEEKQST